jgi:hypothetical protein
MCDSNEQNTSINDAKTIAFDFRLKWARYETIYPIIIPLYFPDRVFHHRSRLPVYRLILQRHADVVALQCKPECSTDRCLPSGADNVGCFAYPTASVQLHRNPAHPTGQSAVTITHPTSFHAHSRPSPTPENSLTAQGWDRRPSFPQWEPGKGNLSTRFADGNDPRHFSVAGDCSQCRRFLWAFFDGDRYAFQMLTKHYRDD